MPWWGILLICCGAALLMGGVATALLLAVHSCRDYLRRCEAIYRGDEQLLSTMQRLPIEWAGVQEALKNHLNRILAIDREKTKRELTENPTEEDAITILGGKPLQEAVDAGKAIAGGGKISKLERLGRIGQAHG